MTVTIWHNAQCSASRKALAYLRDKGLEPEVFEYMKAPPTVDVIQAVLDQLSMKPSELLRAKEAAAKELGLNTTGVAEETILAAMADNPRLIQRPIIVTAKGAVVARPETLADDVL